MAKKHTEHTPEEYYVSYNRNDTSIYGCDTTAIVIGNQLAFLILNGDHRNALRGMTLGEACAYFHANIAHKNRLSDNHQCDRLRMVDGKWKMVRLLA